MTRRNLMATAAGAALTSPARPAAARSVTAEVVRLKLRHTWTTTMSSSEFRDNLYVRYTADGIAGVGEGAPIIRYKESAAEAANVVESIRPMLSAADPRQYRKVITEVFDKVPGQYAMKAAIDIALM